MPIRTFDDGFYPASRARDIAAGNGAANSIVLQEINALQVAIDSAAKAGKLRIEIGDTEGNSTVMTNVVSGDVFREAFAGTQDSFESAFPSESYFATRLQMDRVIGYFTRQGYQIKREDQLGNSPTTFNWIIRW